MTDAFTESLEARVAEIAAIKDLVERGLAAREAREHMAVRDRELYAIQRAVVQELKPGRTWEEVGRLFGRSHAWAEALATARSSKRRKSEHAAQQTPTARETEGHGEDTSTP
ncbi:hypothetical protein [Streptomyces olivaceus]|uniref:hypothetical protein n=1 Tax=Streptomyces olivaceus TaxID=47716 RepID=UPI0036C5ADC1